MTNDLLLINVEIVIGSFINVSVPPSINCIESSHLWYFKLGHLNFCAQNNTKNLESILELARELKSKCQLYVEAKKLRSLFIILLGIQTY